MARGKWGSSASSGALSIQQGIQESEAKIRGLFKEAKALYAPEGEYMAGTEAQLARGRKKAVAGGMQGLAAAGLAGTSMAGGLAKKYEEEVAAPTMAQATTQRLSALSNLLAQEAGAEMQMSLRPPITIGGGGGSSATPGFPTTRIPSTRTRPQARPRLRPQAQVQQKIMPAPPSYPSAPSPAGEWQATIGGTSFYSTGTGGFTQKQAPAPPGHAASAKPKPKPLSSFYSSNLMQQADPYNISGRYS